VLSTSQFQSYIDIVKDAYTYRGLIKMAEKITANAYDQKPVEEIL
jgi:replicative DNA helicase